MVCPTAFIASCLGAGASTSDSDLGSKMLFLKKFEVEIQNGGNAEIRQTTTHI